MQAQCVWDAGAVLGEGTLWSVREQALYWVDILGRRLHRLRAGDGARDTWDFDREITAVAERAAAPGLVVTLREGWATFDPARPAPPAWLHRPDAEPPGNRFNDGKCDARGRFWGGTMDFDCVARTGSFYCLHADGACVRHDLGFAVTNGPAWSADGRTIFINETAHARTWAWDFDAASGAISNRRLWRRWDAGAEGLPDGMTTDAAGRLWIAHWGGGCVTAHDAADGRTLHRIELPASHVTDVAFGGPALTTLYVTTARDKLDAARLAAEPLAGGLFAVELAAHGIAGVAPTPFAG